MNQTLLMARLSQRIKNNAKFLNKKNKSPALKKNPQKKGVCLRVYTRTPKKPKTWSPPKTAIIPTRG